MADRPIRWMGRPVTRVSRSRTASRCQPRSSPANACTSSTTIARSPANSSPCSTLRLISIASSDSGVVSSMSGGSRSSRCRADAPTSPCQIATRRPSQLRIARQPGQQVVQQRLQRADVDDRQAGPAPRVHRGQQREHRRLGLAARRRREQQRVGPVQDRPGCLFLQRAQRRPAQGVDDVVHHDRVQPVQPGDSRQVEVDVVGRAAARAARPARCVPPRTARPARGSARSGGAGRSRRTGQPGPGRRRPAS